MAEFYRVLDPMTKNRWVSGLYNGTHRHPPGEWIAKWTKDKSQNPNDYPLKCAWGRHTNEARASFIQNAAARTNATGEPWPDAVLIRAGELEGACVWREPAQAWKYAVEGDPELTWIVVLDGEAIGEIPEDKGGGVQVAVHDAGEIYSMEEFADRYGFAMPKGDIDLDASDENGTE